MPAEPRLRHHAGQHDLAGDRDHVPSSIVAVLDLAEREHRELVSRAPILLMNLHRVKDDELRLARAKIENLRMQPKTVDWYFKETSKNNAIK